MKRALDYSLFGLGFALAVAIFPGTIDGFLTLRWAIIASAVPLLLLALGDRVAPFPWLFAAFIAAAVGSMLWAVDRAGAFDDASHVVMLGAAFWLGASLSNATHLWKGVSIGVAASAAVAMAQWGFGWTGVPSAVDPGGLFANKNILAEAGMVALLASLAMGGAVGRVLAVAALIAVLLGGSKAVFAGLAVAFAFWIAPRSQRLAWAILAALGLAAVSMFFVFPIVSATVRWEMWVPALTDLTPFGHGMGSFAAAFPQAEHAHSEPVQLAYEMGLFALIPALIFLKAMEEWSGELEGYLLVGILADGLFAFPLHLPLTAFVAAVAAGRLVGARDRLVRRRFEGGLAVDACA